MSKNPHLGGDALESLDKIIPDTHETRLIGLIEACKIVLGELEGGRSEFAKQFLAWALADAEKPPHSPLPIPQCPITNDE